MCENSEKQFPLNHGWEHFWFHPKNLFIKELVKGPFLKPKLLYSIPYVTLCQHDGVSVRLEEGIPDCWAEYLAHNFLFLRKYLRKYELMHKEDVEIVPHLRKNYRLYIGQGIPDPWISYPYIGNPHSNPKDIRKSQWPHHRKENCYCCEENCYCREKKYLFDCADKTNIKACRCPDYHGRYTTLAADCGENCKCISVLRDWLLKNTDIKQRKNRRRKANPESDLSSSNDSKTEDEGPNVKAGPPVFCECLRHYKVSSDTSVSEIGEKWSEKLHDTYNKNKIFSKTQSRICCCPYVKNIYLKTNSSPDGRNFPESTKAISKKIQTENPPDKDSKTVQTDNLKPKFKLKCQCSMCSHCGLPQCRAPWTKLTYPAMQSVPNLCFTPSVIHNPAIICPYSFPNHFMLQKPSKHGEIRKANKKQEKSRVDEDHGSTAELKGKRQQSKADEESVLWKSEAKDPPTDSKNDDFNNDKSIYYCQPSTKSFDHIKYLTDEKLKLYLQRQERKKPNHSGSKFMNFSLGEPSVSITDPERFKIGRFKAFSYCKPKLSESFEDNKMVYLGNSRRHAFSKLFNSSDQAIMTVPEEAKKSKNEVFSKVKYYKETGESDESKGRGQMRNCNKANRRRRRLLSNRKRRRKLAASGMSSILEYEALLNKLKKFPELVNKEVQVEDTDQDHHFSKKVSFSGSNSSPLGILNFSGNISPRHQNVSQSFGKLICAATSKKFEPGIVKNEFVGYSKSRIVGESLRQSLQSDLRFGGALEKISNTNRATWTSNALKNIVDDILIEKKSHEKLDAEE